MKVCFKLLFCLCCIGSYAQVKPIMVFDLQNNSLDSLPVPIIDTSLTKGKTQFYLGNFNTNYANLDSIAPAVHVFPNSQFALKTRLDKNYIIEDFPIRATIALSFWKNDTLAQICSGNMISTRHAILSAHCISTPVNGVTQLHDFDSLMVSSVPNDGQQNPNFGNAKVKKLFLFKSWRRGSEDMVVLELEEAIGEKTGYIGIGFNDNDLELSNEIFYKFSYPAVSYFLGDSNEYNGDTLYSSFGLLNYFQSNIIGVDGGRGVPGESGSSLIRTRYKRDYTSFGIFSFALNYSHSRFNSFRYHSLKAIIENDLISEDEPLPDLKINSIYPNPCEDGFYLEQFVNQKIGALNIYDALGKLVLKVEKPIPLEKIDVSFLKPGFYNLEIEINTRSYFQKLVKK